MHDDDGEEPPQDDQHPMASYGMARRANMRRDYAPMVSQRWGRQRPVRQNLDGNSGGSPSKRGTRALAATGGRGTRRHGHA